MKKSELFINSMRKLKTPQNAVLVESIIEGFNEIQNAPETKQRMIAESIQRLESIRNGRDPIEFVKMLTKNVCAYDDPAVIMEALNGLDEYKKYLSKISPELIMKSSFNSVLSATTASINQAQTKAEILSAVDIAITKLTQLKTTLSTSGTEFETTPLSAGNDQSTETLQTISNIVDPMFGMPDSSEL